MTYCIVLAQRLLERLLEDLDLVLQKGGPLLATLVLASLVLICGLGSGLAIPKGHGLFLAVVVWLRVVCRYCLMGIILLIIW